MVQKSPQRLAITFWKFGNGGTLFSPSCRPTLAPNRFPPLCSASHPPRGFYLPDIKFGFSAFNFMQLTRLGLGTVVSDALCKALVCRLDSPPPSGPKPLD